MFFLNRHFRMWIETTQRENSLAQRFNEWVYIYVLLLSWLDGEESGAFVKEQRALFWRKQRNGNNSRDTNYS